ncbi:MAG: hypothetical protein IJ250_04350, partial [Bacteroidales bacterium]|nr:hypothetical protein [Bacteroidales bacterium]
KYKPSSNVEISNMTQFSRTCLNADDSLSEAGLTDMFATQGSEFKKMSFSDEFAVNVKTSKGLLSAHVSFEAVNRNYTYDLLTDNNILPVTYTQIAVNSFNLNTDKEIKNYTFSPDVTYAYQLTDVLNLQTTLAYNYNKNKFSYNDLSSKESEDLTWNEYSATLQLGKNKGFFRFYAGAELRNTHWKTGIEGLDNGSSWHVLPKGSVSLHFSSTHQLSLNANTDNEAIETEYLLRNKMVSGYSSLYLGSDITNPFTKSKNLSVNYNYHNLYSSTMLFCSAGLRENDLVKAHSVQDSSVVMMSKYGNDGHMQSKYLSAHLTQGLGSIPVDLQTGMNSSQSTNETSLNGVHDKMNSLNCSLNLGFISRMKKILNFELSGSYSASKYDYKVSTASNDMAEFGGNAALIFVYKNLTANVRYTFSYLDNETFGRNYSRLGFRAEYRINKFRIHVQGSNVLNVKNMDWVSISANQSYSSSTFYKKIPGYVLAGLSYRW